MWSYCHMSFSQGISKWTFYWIQIFQPNVFAVRIVATDEVLLFVFWYVALISGGYHDKVPQTELLETTEIYCARILDSRCSKSTCWQGCSPSEIWGESLPASSWCPGAATSPSCFLASSSITPVSVRVIAGPCPVWWNLRLAFLSSYKDTIYNGFQTILTTSS